MGVEIERKFLVNKKLWANKKTAVSGFLIRQCYLVAESDIVLRVRTVQNRGMITIKKETRGISRDEFEYEIPLTDANRIIGKFPEATIEKIRHRIKYENKIWEVDVFRGKNEGLIIAEIELLSAKEKFKKPEWAGKEVTKDYKYSNSNLTKKPFKQW